MRAVGAALKQSGVTRVLRGAYILLLCSSALWCGCGDEESHPDPVVYDDPANTYNPPTFNGGKADEARSGPRIAQVSWSPTGSCSVDSISSVEIIVELDGHEEHGDDLIFDGAATGCNGTESDYGPMISSARSIITCHNVSEHEGMITVVDRYGSGDSIFFKFDSCRAGRISSDD